MLYRRRLIHTALCIMFLLCANTREADATLILSDPFCYYPPNGYTLLYQTYSDSSRSHKTVVSVRLKNSSGYSSGKIDGNSPIGTSEYCEFKHNSVEFHAVCERQSNGGYYLVATYKTQNVASQSMVRTLKELVHPDRGHVLTGISARKTHWHQTKTNATDYRFDSTTNSSRVAGYSLLNEVRDFRTNEGDVSGADYKKYKRTLIQGSAGPDEVINGNVKYKRHRSIRQQYHWDQWQGELTNSQVNFDISSNPRRREKRIPSYYLEFIDNATGIDDLLFILSDLERENLSDNLAEPCFDRMIGDSVVWN